MKRKTQTARQRTAKKAVPRRREDDDPSARRGRASAAGLAHAAVEWRATVDAMRDAVSLLDTEGRILRCNRAMQKLVGLSFEKIIGRSCWDLVYGQHLPPAGSHFAARGGAHSGRFFTTRLIRERWYAISVEPIRGKSGARTGAVHVMADLSETKQAKEDLKHYAEHLKLLRNLDLAILEVRPPGEIAGEVLNRVRRQTSIRFASVTRFDPECREVQVIAVICDGTIQPTDARLPADPDWVACLTHNDTCEVSDPRILLPENLWGSTLGEAGVALSFSIPLLATRKLIGALNLGFPPRAQLSAVQDATMRQVALSLAVSLQNASLFESVTEQRERLRELSSRMTNVEEALRLHLAQELHDRVGQTLTALGINLNHARSLLAGKSPKAVRRLDESIREIEEISDSIRDVMSELRPAVLDDYGLAAALRCYGQQFAHRTGIDIEVVETTATTRLPGDVEIALFRIAQEALTNVSKHAHATHVKISVNTTQLKVVLTIQDDGVGFKPKAAASRSRSKSAGWGLLTMKERAERVGGTCSVVSRGGGTRVTITVGRTR